MKTFKKADSIKINRKNTLMVAHRGLSGIEKENSMPAFVAAGNHSHFGIETDVHRTRDGKFVIIHDDSTGRVCKSDYSVEGSDFDLLRSLCLTDTDGSEGRCDLHIPTLAEYIGVCRKYAKISVLELKNDFSSEDIAKIIDTIKELDYLENVIFISFSYENLVKLRKILPNQKAQFLTGEFTDDLPDKLTKYGLDLDIYFSALTSERVELLHSKNIEVNCWTVDRAEDAERLVDMGVDYITSNILE